MANYLPTCTLRAVRIPHWAVKLKTSLIPFASPSTVHLAGRIRPDAPTIDGHPRLLGSTGVEGNRGDEEQQRQNVPAKQSSDCDALAATAFLLIDVPAQLPHTGGELLRGQAWRI